MAPTYSNGQEIVSVFFAIKSNPKQDTDPISLHTKFGDNSSNTFPLNEWKPCVTPDMHTKFGDNSSNTFPLNEW